MPNRVVSLVAVSAVVIVVLAIGYESLQPVPTVELADAEGAAASAPAVGDGCSADESLDWSLERAQDFGSTSPGAAIDQELQRTEAERNRLLNRRSASPIAAQDATKLADKSAMLTELEPPDGAAAREARAQEAQTWMTPSNATRQGEVTVELFGGGDRWVVTEVAWQLTPEVCETLRSLRSSRVRPTALPSAQGFSTVPPSPRPASPAG